MLIGIWAVFDSLRVDTPAGVEGSERPDTDERSARSQGPEKSKETRRPAEAGGVVITEILYEPRRREMRERFGGTNSGPYMEEGNDPAGQYVEIFNRRQERVDLTGWSFTKGIAFEFPPGSKIDAGAYAVVCRDPVALSKRFPGVTHFGGFTGSLDPGGERLTLSNADNAVVDSVRYDDRPPWPIAPDESGISLEVIDPFEENNTAANWRGSRESFDPKAKKSAKAVKSPPARRVNRDGWFLVTNTGRATSNRLYFYLDSAGDWLVDDVSFRVAKNRRNILKSGSFNSGERGWMKTGNHRGSFRNRRGGRRGTGCMQIRSTAAGGSRPNSLQTVVGSVRRGQTCTISFWVKRLRGSSALTCRMSESGLWTTITSVRVGDEWRYRVEKEQAARRPAPEVAGAVGGGTPGRQNSVFGRGVPPSVTDLDHSPAKPTSKDEVTVTVTVRPSSSALVSVRLLVSLGMSTSVEVLDMFDDGAHGDGAGGDGVHGVRVSSRPSQTLVHYRVRAEDADGRVVLFPHEGEPSETRAYFHYDGEIDTNLTLYHLFVPPETLRYLDRNRHTRVYQDCSLVVDGVAYPHVGARYRGAGSRQSFKRQWKFRFNKGQLYNGNRVLDTMVAMPVIQRIVFRVADHLGIENLESDLVRVHLNGQFWGVYVVFESPNSAWLAKHGYDPSAQVYKGRSVSGGARARSSDLFRTFDYTDNDYWGIWNKKVESLEPPTHIRDLTVSLNDLPDSKLLPWLDAHVDVDQFLTRWAFYILLGIDDFPAHNYYLFLPRHPGGKWKWLSYDFDSLGRMAPIRVLYGDGKGGESPDWQRNRFCQIVSDNPTLRRLYFLKLREMIERRCRQGDIFKIVDDEATRSARDRALDASKWRSSGSTTGMKSGFARQVQLVRRFLTKQKLPGKREVPKLRPAGGTFDEPVSVRFSVPRGWRAYYTLDGGDPRLSKTRLLYKKPIRLEKSTTLKAAAARGPRVVETGDWTDLVERTFDIESRGSDGASSSETAAAR